MDYVNVGAIGFSQLGTPDYFDKRKIEKSVMRKLIDEDPRFKIPENLIGICWFGIKKFPYDDGSYEEIVLYYEDRIIEKSEDDQTDLHYDFYNFSGEAECIDLETEELMLECQKQYSMTVVHIKNDDENLDNNLKKAE